MSQMWVSQGVVGIVAIGLGIIGGVLQYVFKTSWVWSYLGVAVPAILIPLIVHGRRQNLLHREFDAAFPERDDLPDDTFRIRVIGTPAELARFGDLADLPFE